MTRSLLLLAVLIGAVACGGSKNNGGTPVEVEPGTRPSIRETVKKNWEALRAKVRNADQREEKILDMIKEAGIVFEKVKLAKDAGDDGYKKLLAKAKDLYEEANGLYDTMRDDADTVDKDLWITKFKSFQSQWERYSTKDLRRMFSMK
jgi:hypothetical protein